MDPRPLLIVTTGDENLLELCEENLEEIVKQIPDDMKVSVVSVVGAFRTGKSFLLNFFLRYLRHGDINDLTEDWMVKDGALLSEGNLNSKLSHMSSSASTSSVYDDEEENELEEEEKLSFGWRGGSERQTTGIWMWSIPFYRQNSHNLTEKIAILLVDTQGMFDNETTMTVTAQVFGLSTLISSFQIYNVDKRIQEDNLQHLALFSEYGRMALDKPDAYSSSNSSTSDNDADGIKSATEAALLCASVVASNVNEESNQNIEIDNNNDNTATTGTTNANANTNTNAKLDCSSPSSSITADSLSEEDSGFVSIRATNKNNTQDNNNSNINNTAVCVTKPFQRLQFLVRDWQNFDDGWDGEEEEDDDDDTQVVEKYDGSSDADMDKENAKLKIEKQSTIYEGLRRDMDVYLYDVIKDRGMADLHATREQIARCFDTVDCFLLPHPGSAVTKKNYSGKIMKIESFFRGLLNRYVRLVFDENIEPKIINNRALTGRGLQQFFIVYCKMFQEGGTSFPKAMTMLEATAEANNRDAYDRSKSHYVKRMDTVAGIGCVFMKESSLVRYHDKYSEESINQFNEIATMGSLDAINNYRAKLLDEISVLKRQYFDTNAIKNPFKGIELYALPIIIAAVSWLFAKIIHISCGGGMSGTCDAAELAFHRIFLIILCGVVVFTWEQLSGTFENVKHFIWPLIAQQFNSMQNRGGAIPVTKQ